MTATSDAAEPNPVFTDRLVFLHGFSQTHHHWHRCAQLIADRSPGTPTLAFVDLPGHGLSGGDRGEINDCAHELVGVAGQGTYVGYSMGGRFALSTALEGGRQVERLVLIGATPGIEDAAERAERQRLDARRAERLEQIGLEAFIDEWLAAPLFDHLPSDAHGLAHRHRNTVDGLAHSLRMCGTGRQISLWDRLDRIRVPVLVIAGELDTKFTAIGQRMTGQLPDATFVAIPGAGHAAHSELPEATADVIAGWLARR